MASFRIKVLFLLLVIYIPGTFPQNPSARIMVYNVENLFDTDNDTLRNDDDFLPEGLMRWNYTRYQKKISSLYKTIVAAGGWKPPAIVAFCEIENRKVIEDIIYKTYLSKYRFRIIHEDSPDERGIDVALIFDEDQVKLIGYQYWMPQPEKGLFTSRSILYSCFVTGTDTIHLIINHWPSRRGGVLAGENLRLRIADMVRGKADSIYLRNKGRSKIIIAGDFNCTPGDNEISRLTDPEGSSCIFRNLSAQQSDEGIGTYRYQGNWEMIDQMIVSEYLLTDRSGIFTRPEDFSVFKPDFLLKKDPKYPGFMPFSTYRGFKYQGGYSDHLPVLLNLVILQPR